MSISPPPYRDKDLTSQSWQKWFASIPDALKALTTAAGNAVSWASINKTGSKLSDIETRNHSDLQNLNTPTHVHLTSTQYNGLTGGGITNLHQHNDSAAGKIGGEIFLLDIDMPEAIDGRPGRDGINGRDGVNGLNGQDGEDGQDGFNGKDGKNGIDGINGLNGLDGEDGEINYLYASKNNNPLDYSLIGSMGTNLVSGGALSVNANPALFNIAVADFHFINGYTTPDAPTFKEVHYIGSTANAVTNLATQDSTYISIDVNGTIFQTATKPFGVDLRDKILLGALVHTNRTSISSADSNTNVIGYNVPNTMSDISMSIGPINSGNSLSGNAVNTLRINKTAGTFTQTGINWKTDRKNPNIITTPVSTGSAFLATWRNGTGGWTTAVKTDIIPGVYDDGTGGATQPSGVVSNNKWTLVKWFYLPNSQIIGIEFGQVVYNSLAEAEANKSAATLDNPALSSVPFRGWIAVRGGATNLTLAGDASFIDADKFGSIASGGGTGSLVPTMQSSYNNSVQPQITTSTTLGAVQVKRGSAADTDVVFEVLNGAGTPVFQVTGLGLVGTSISLAQARAISTLRI